MSYLNGYLTGYAPGGTNSNPSTAWDKIPVYGHWREHDDTPKAGTWKAECHVRVVNATRGLIYPPGVVASGTLDNSGNLTFQALANDDPDLNRRDWKLVITVTFTDGTAETYTIDTPLTSLANTPPGVDLATKTPG